MNRYNILAFSVMILFSCKEQTHDDTQHTQGLGNKTEQDSIAKVTERVPPGHQEEEEIEKGKLWLIHSIEDTFKATNDTNDEVIPIYTKRYEEYKSDAINVDMDGGMTEKQFFNKWEDQYNPKMAGVGYGFLIGGQDWGKIKVTYCEVKTKMQDNSLIFNVVIEDLEFKVKYKRDIKIIRSENTYLIDDVLEYN